MQKYIIIKKSQRAYVIQIIFFSLKRLNFLATNLMRVHTFNF